MKKGTVLSIHKGKKVPIQIHHNSPIEDLGYNGIKDGNYLLSLDNCDLTISIKDRIEINRYQFEIQEASGDSITMRYTGLRKKAK